MLAGIATLFLLPDRPEQAAFLDSSEKAWLAQRLALEDARIDSHSRNPLATLLDARVLLMSICFVASAVLANHALQFAFLCLAAAGIFAGQPVFWNLPSKFLKGAGAAAGLAATNSVGNLGGFIAQNVVPWIRDATGSATAPMFFLAFCLAITALLVLVVQYSIARKDGSQTPGSMIERA